VNIEAGGLQIRPPDVAQLRNSGHLMVPIGVARGKFDAGTDVFLGNPGQHIVPSAANGSYF
jgi:hypothetical protein